MYNQQKQADHKILSNMYNVTIIVKLSSTIINMYNIKLITFSLMFIKRKCKDIKRSSNSLENTKPTSLDAFVLL